MAYLNVRERRLETKIAYVGARSSGRATNFERLGVGRVIDDQLSLFWEPKGDVAFRDCKVRAELVSTPGDVSAEAVRKLVQSADGVVFVADAAALDGSREVLALLREALAELTHPVPVVVQVNKTDLASPATVLEDLAVGDWPYVPAAAISGEGVTETAERALDLVLESLRRREVTTEEAAPTANRNGNPLLNALRQVLRETVAEHVNAMEERNQARLDRLVAEIGEQREDLARMRATLAAVTTTLGALGDTTEGMTLESVRQGAEVARQLDALVKANREQQNALAGVKRGLDALPAEIRTHDPTAAVTALRSEGDRATTRLLGRVAESEVATARALGELDAKTTALGAQFEALIEELKKPKKSWFG